VRGVLNGKVRGAGGGFDLKTCRCDWRHGRSRDPLHVQRARVEQASGQPCRLREAGAARVTHLTCGEVDRAFADALSRRNVSRNVSVVSEDATAMSFPTDTFDGAVCFTMLHHVPSVALQDRLLSEVAPGPAPRWHLRRYRQPL
jgi:hypothetical protein